MKQSKTPFFPKNSRMKNYQIIFDSNVKQNRVAFYNFDANKMEYSKSDEIYTITKGMEYRLDLISIKFYGSATYDWLIAEYNKIEDPIRDIVSGKKIRIPKRANIGRG
jgi:hypothetical protein